MTQLYGIQLCCKPLVIVMICSIELSWVMIDVLELHACNCSLLKICILTYFVNDFENGIMHFHMHWVT